MNLRVKIVDQQERDHSPAAPVARGKKVLLVDDSNFCIEFEKSALGQLEDLQMLTATSGIEALRIIEAERPDLVYLDLAIDNMGGDECCRIIKKTYAESIPVVMLTHGNSVEAFDLCWEARCDGIIVKPVNQHLLVATTKKYLKLRPSVSNRGDIRHAARVKVRYGSNQQETLSDYSINLSTGGLFLATTVVLSIDTRFMIEFTVPGRPTPICCKARVAWVNDPQQLSKQDMPPGMGLQFIDIALSDVDAIREYLSGGRLLASW